MYFEGNFWGRPFQGLASYSGSNRARGYFQGRFIDKQMYVAQAEYRYRFHPRWAINGLGLFGEVADSSRDLFNFINETTAFACFFLCFSDDTIWFVGLKNHNHEQTVSKSYENPIKLSFTKKNKL